jgi:hypothetical protein
MHQQQHSPQPPSAVSQFPVAGTATTTSMPVPSRKKKASRVGVSASDKGKAIAAKAALPKVKREFVAKTKTKPALQLSPLKSKVGSQKTLPKVKPVKPPKAATVSSPPVAADEILRIQNLAAMRAEMDALKLKKKLQSEIAAAAAALDMDYEEAHNAQRCVPRKYIYPPPDWRYVADMMWLLKLPATDDMFCR